MNQFILKCLFFLGVVPFQYDLHLTTLPGGNRRTMICLHGYGDSYQIAEVLRDLYNPDVTLVGFNFPEHDIKEGRAYDPKKASFGSIDELLPLFYVMKKVVLDQGLDSVDLYGFSAGGGAVVNAIGVLNRTAYDAELKKLGIGKVEKARLLTAIQRGIVVLDTPLKSVEEIIDFRGASEELEILAQKYRDCDARPIDALKRLEGLSLNILLHFQKEDEILSNRDDELYIERLKAYQKKVKVIIADEGGHMAPHYELWKEYARRAAF
ncbi:MAG: hypothetical protein JSS32_05630 [Verrucomicrobia bacterium]|nr:hypothetical protein [Verrucomicrobiota bacterium]